MLEGGDLGPIFGDATSPVAGPWASVIEALRRCESDGRLDLSVRDLAGVRSRSERRWRWCMGDVRLCEKTGIATGGFETAPLSLLLIFMSFLGNNHHADPVASRDVGPMNFLRTDFQNFQPMPRWLEHESIEMSHPKMSIRSITARAVVAPMPRPLRTASGDILSAPLVLVDVLTEEGVTGRGYTFAYTPITLRSIVQFITDIAPELVGKAVSPRSRMRQIEKKLKLVGEQGFAGMAVGALDMALWDALACAADLPLASLLGGEVRPLPAYDSYGILDVATDLPWLEESVAAGFEAVKIKLGAGDVANDVSIVSAARRTIGPDVRLMLDFNQSQTTASAVERISRLREFDLTWVEEPVSADDLIGHRAVRERVAPVAIQTGENWWFPRGMANAIAAGASDLAMVDIMKIGGVTGWLSAMGQAEAASLPLSNHTFVEPSAHVMAASPTASWFEYLDIAGAVLTERLLPVKGTVTPRGPGLGLVWDEKAVAKYAYQ